MQVKAHWWGRQAVAIVVVLGSMVIPAPQLFGEHDPCGSALKYLRQQDVSKVGRESLVEAYEVFIGQYVTDPRACEAMLAIANLYADTEIPELNIRPDPERAMGWFRKAAKSSSRGSEMWVKAKLRISHALRWSNSAEARQVVEDIGNTMTDNTSVLAKVEGELQQIAISERNLDLAESHCRRLLGWYRNRHNIPTDDLVKAEVDATIISSGSLMVTTLRQAPWPATKRTGRIIGLMRDYAGLQALQREGMEAVKALRESVHQEATPLAEERLRQIDLLLVGEHLDTGRSPNALRSIPSKGASSGPDGMSPGQGISQETDKHSRHATGEAAKIKMLMLASVVAVLAAAFAWTVYRLRGRKHA